MKILWSWVRAIMKKTQRLWDNQWTWKLEGRRGSQVSSYVKLCLETEVGKKMRNINLPNPSLRMTSNIGFVALRISRKQINPIFSYPDGRPAFDPPCTAADSSRRPPSTWSIHYQIWNLTTPSHPNLRLAIIHLRSTKDGITEAMGRTSKCLQRLLVEWQRDSFHLLRIGDSLESSRR